MESRILTGIVLVSAVITAFSVGAFSPEFVHGESTGSPNLTGLTEKAIQTGQTPHSFAAKASKTYTGRYLLYLPEEYGKDNKSWPLIIFLHGSGERIGRGSIHPKLSKVGLPKTLQKGGNFPFIVLTPQCPTGKWWSDPDVSEMVMAMLDEVCKKYKVDKSRIYLTGLSMGGYGTWSLAQQNPHRFAAIVPVCGGGNIYLNNRLKNVPVWVFHGAKDKRVKVRNAYEMAGSLKKIGGNVQMHIFPNLGHFIWDSVYTNPKLYEWLIQQKLRPTRKKAKTKRVKSTDIKKATIKIPTKKPAGK